MRTIIFVTFILLMGMGMDMQLSNNSETKARSRKLVLANIEEDKVIVPKLLKKVIHIQRHGARTSESEGMQLTEKGQEQLKDLGRSIYRRYSPMLPDPFQFFSRTVVYSSNYNRTIQSAEHFLIGLFEGIMKNKTDDIFCKSVNETTSKERENRIVLDDASFHPNNIDSDVKSTVKSSGKGSVNLEEDIQKMISNENQSTNPEDLMQEEQLESEDEQLNDEQREKEELQYLERLRSDKEYRKWTSTQHWDSKEDEQNWQNTLNQVELHVQGDTKTEGNVFGDLLLNGWRQSECEKQGSLIKEQLSKHYLQDILQKLQPVMNDISQLTGRQLSSFRDAYYLWDELISKTSEGQLDPLFYLLSKNETMYKTLEFMNDFSAIYLFYGQSQQTKMTTMTPMHKIREILFTDDFQHSFTIFSGHDITLDGIFVALNLTSSTCIANNYQQRINVTLPLEEHEQHRYKSLIDPHTNEQICFPSPPFGASIQIELYDENSIVFVYNGQVYPIPALESLHSFNMFIQDFYKQIHPTHPCQQHSHKYYKSHIQSAKPSE